MNKLLDSLKAQIAPLFDSELHKLAGLAAAAYGINIHNWQDLTAGAAYAAIVHLADQIKKT